MFQITLIKKSDIDPSFLLSNDKINKSAMVKEIAWNWYTENSDCILDIYDNFAEDKKTTEL